MKKNKRYKVIVTFHVDACSPKEAHQHMVEEAWSILDDRFDATGPAVRVFFHPSPARLVGDVPEEDQSDNHEFSQAERMRDGMAGDIYRDMTAGEEDV
jgi:hypothetical protein